MSQDNDLQQQVLAELKWEPSVVASNIGVTAKGGVITLTGKVCNFGEKHAAEMAAGRVKGVKAVAEEIEVKLPFDMKRGDDDIAAAALHRFAWNSSVPLNAIKVKVEKGWITLTGEVEWSYQKEAAANDVRYLFGVVGVSNQIAIKPRANAEDIREDIQDALGRSWFYDPNTIEVSATGGQVRLTGTVHSWYDRQVAGSTAWAAPGATGVENDLMVA